MFWLIAAILIYGVLCLVFYLWQARLLFRPIRRIVLSPDQIGLAFEEAEFFSRDGTRLHGWLIPSTSATTVLFCHPNTGNIGHNLDTALFFHQLGLGVFLFDYRCYGNSVDALMTQENMLNDCQAAWEWLRGRGVSPENILIMGRSIGGPHAAWLASENQALALILEGTFSSLARIGREHYPWLPTGLLNKFTYPTEEWVSRCRCPVMIFHSRQDEVIGFHHAEKLYEVASNPKVLIPLMGNHNDAFLQSEEYYKEQWVRFLGLIAKEGKHESDT